jgi:hypothetical protein
VVRCPLQILSEVTRSLRITDYGLWTNKKTAAAGQPAAAA